MFLTAIIAGTLVWANAITRERSKISIDTTAIKNVDIENAAEEDLDIAIAKQAEADGINVEKLKSETIKTSESSSSRNSTAKDALDEVKIKLSDIDTKIQTIDIAE